MVDDDDGCVHSEFKIFQHFFFAFDQQEFEVLNFLSNKEEQFAEKFPSIRGLGFSLISGREFSFC